MKKAPSSLAADQRRIMRLAWPAVIENLSSTMVSFVDTAMVGSLGSVATAAVAVNASPSWLLNGIIMSLGVGGTALVARMIGSGDREDAGRISRQVIAMTFVVSIVLTLVTLALADYVPVMMRADPILHKDAAAYLRIVALGFIPSFTGFAVSAMLRGAGDTKTPMRAGILSNVLNVFGNFLLIYKTRPLQVLGIHLTIPGAGLGIRGAAISTAISTAIAGIYLFRHLYHADCPLYQKRFFPFRFDRTILLRVLRISLPAALERLSINLGQIVFAGFISAIGTDALAAHHLGITIEALGYMPGYGFAVSATTMVGQELGAGNPKQAKSYGLKSTMLGVVIMSLIGVLLFVFAKPLICLFTPDENVRFIGANLLRICAFEQPFSALTIIVPGALRGAGDTVTPFVISLLSMWGVRIVFAYLLGTVLGFGVYGIWFAMVMDLAVRGGFMLLRFSKGKWQTKEL